MSHDRASEDFRWAEIVPQMIVSALPVIGGPAQVLLAAAQQRDKAVVERYIHDVTDRAGKDVLAERLSNAPVVEALFLTGAGAALRTGLDAKRRLLAVAVTRAVLDDAVVDEAQLYVAALEDLDAAHFRAMERLRRVIDDPAGQASERALEEAWIAEPVPVRAALVRTGCSGMPGPVFTAVGGDPSQYLTEFGRELLAHVRQHDKGPGQLNGR